MGAGRQTGAGEIPMGILPSARVGKEYMLSKNCSNSGNLSVK